MRMIDLSTIRNPKECCLDVAQRFAARRKEAGYTQTELAKRSGVSLGSLRRFEQTGEISFHSLARLAYALRMEGDFDALFARRQYQSIQEVIDAQREGS